GGYTDQLRQGSRQDGYAAAAAATTPVALASAMEMPLVGPAATAGVTADADAAANAVSGVAAPPGGDTAGAGGSGGGGDTGGGWGPIMADLQRLRSYHAPASESAMSVAASSLEVDRASDFGTPTRASRDKAAAGAVYGRTSGNGGGGGGGSVAATILPECRPGALQQEGEALVDEDAVTESIRLATTRGSVVAAEAVAAAVGAPRPAALHSSREECSIRDGDGGNSDLAAIWGQVLPRKLVAAQHQAELHAEAARAAAAAAALVHCGQGVGRAAELAGVVTHPDAAVDRDSALRGMAPERSGVPFLESDICVGSLLVGEQAE
ncbi:hypothetical protein Vafri_571, partial [Volvox africanus]